MNKKELTAKEALNELCNDIESLIGYFLTPEYQEEYDVDLLKKIILKDINLAESYREFIKIEAESFRLRHPDLYPEDDEYLDYIEEDEEDFEDE